MKSAGLLLPVPQAQCVFQGLVRHSHSHGQRISAHRRSPHSLGLLRSSSSSTSSSIPCQTRSPSSRSQKAKTTSRQRWVVVRATQQEQQGEGEGTETETETEIELVSPSEGMVLLERQGWKFLDLRSAQAYDDEHLTKPAQCSQNVPFPETQQRDQSSTTEFPEDFLGACEAARLSKQVPLLVACEDGSRCGDVARVLVEAGYHASCVGVKGGYRGWREVWTTSGRRVPPKGRWVATGKEALKSGLNVGGAALSYEERLNVEDLAKKEFKDHK